MNWAAGKVAGKMWQAAVALLVALAFAPPAVLAQKPRNYEIRFDTRPPLAASIEQSNERYLLNLVNNSAQEFRGTARISMGDGGAQLEAGQLSVSVPPNESRLLLLNALKATGSQYTLQIFDQQGALVLYKMAAVGQGTGVTASEATAVSLAPEAPSPKPVQTITSPAAPPAAAQPALTAEVQFKVRLVAAAQKVIPEASLEINIGPNKQQKQVAINKHAVVEFNLPEYLESNQLAYALKRKDGSVIAQGTSDLDKLFNDDHVTVSDIRTDRVAYGPGELARITVVLEGQSPNGYKLETLARDSAGNTFFTNTIVGAAGEEAKEQQFNVAVPGDIKGPIIFEFKVYDGQTGMLYDSGEREIAFRAGKAG
jgi:hypothetical protein